MADKKIPLNEPGIAGFETESWASAEEPRYGENVATTTHERVTSTVALDLPLYTPVNITPAGVITQAVVATGVSNANALLAAPLSLAANQTMSIPVYREGHWSMTALNWHASYTTDALKIAAFQGGKSPTLFVSKKLFSNDAIDI